MSSGTYQPKMLTVFFDSDCMFCIRCAAWLEREPCFFPVRLVPMRSPAVKEMFPSVAEEIEKGTFVVVDDRGGIYFDSAARLMCLYATRRYRALSSRLSGPALRPLVDRFFEALGQNRYRLSRLLRLKPPAKGQAVCADGRCAEPNLSKRSR